MSNSNLHPISITRFRSQVAPAPGKAYRKRRQTKCSACQGEPLV